MVSQLLANGLALAWDLVANGLAMLWLMFDCVCGAMTLPWYCFGIGNTLRNHWVIGRTLCVWGGYWETIETAKPLGVHWGHYLGTIGTLVGHHWETIMTPFGTPLRHHWDSINTQFAHHCYTNVTPFAYH